jgi:hypothetical protein
MLHMHARRSAMLSTDSTKYVSVTRASVFHHDQAAFPVKDSQSTSKDNLILRPYSEMWWMCVQTGNEALDRVSSLRKKADLYISLIQGDAQVDSARLEPASPGHVGETIPYPAPC